MSLTIPIIAADGAQSTVTLTDPVVVSGIVPMPAIVQGAGLAQRPVLSGSMLSWQGPVGGGVSNGDYTLQSITLVTSSSITTTDDGQVIEGKSITGNPCIQINHNNVTVRKCALKITPANTDGSYCIKIASGKSGLIVEDCLFDANATSNEGNGIGSNNPPTVNGATIRRNQFVRCAQSVRYVLNNISYTENYCTIVSGGDADYVEVYPVGGTCNNLLIQYNYFDGVDNSVQGADSAINLSTGAGLPKGKIGPNVVIDTNWFIWRSTTQNVAWESHSICNGTGGGTGSGTESLEFTCTNNGIYNGKSSLGYGKNGSILMGAPGSSSPSTNDGGGLIHDSGNYVMANPTARTGTAYPGYNGAGRL